jgi:hypothetical protein
MVKCDALTIKGARCKNSALEGSSKCRVHSKSKASKVVKPKSKTLSKVKVVKPKSKTLSKVVKPKKYAKAKEIIKYKKNATKAKTLFTSSNFHKYIPEWKTNDKIRIDVDWNIHDEHSHIFFYQNDDEDSIDVDYNKLVKPILEDLDKRAKMQDKDDRVDYMYSYIIDLFSPSLLKTLGKKLTIRSYISYDT